MKTLVLGLAMIGSVCLGADKLPSPAVKPPSPDAPAEAEQAWEQPSSKPRKAWKDAQNSFQLAQSNFAFSQEDDGREFEGFIGAGGGGAGGFPLDLTFGPASRGATQPLIVRTGDLAPATLSNLQEDLTVMSRILTKSVERAAGREGRDSAMGIVLSALPGSRRPQGIYLEGYGALFLLQVKFPLLPSPAKEEEKAEHPSDSTWEQTKQELYGPKTAGARSWTFPPSGAAAENSAEYSAEQVETLKKELLEALKNATHLRDLKPEEAITITVLGSRSGSPNRFKHVTTRNGNPRKVEAFAFAEAGSSTRDSTLTMRAKKSDVDAFAKGDIDLEQFKKRVATSTY